MDIKIRTTDPLQTKTDGLVIGVFEQDFQGKLLKELDERLHRLLQKARRNKEFTGKTGEQIVFRPAGDLPAERILLVGLGAKKECRLEILRQAAGKATQQLMQAKLSRVAFALPLCAVPASDPAARVQAIAEGIALAGYRYDQFLSEAERQKRPQPKAITLFVAKSDDQQAAATALDDALKLVDGVCLARDLVNTPGNVKSPQYLAEQAREAAGRSSLKCTILKQKELAKEGFGAMLGVAQGSTREPRLILLEHHGGNDQDAPVVLVGKGVVFDAGGISLKPAEKMDEMKMDMAGGAAVIGTLQAAATLNLPINLVGIVPAVENLPSGTAYRPGDILTSLSGQTIEVLNTDAEGRLILADALTYAKRFKPRLVIDLATLTGACIIALGHHATALLGNDQALVQKLLDAGQDTGERLWQLPLWEDYAEQIKSHVADMKNVGGRPAGTITAAAFLQKFAADFHWAHLDIAGTAWRDEELPYCTKGGTGVGVRLLIRFLQNLVEKA
ncbi:MAG: leucyl aminopeptidase [Desulfuromonadales bacterium]|jgi:leucyl aminopeptidase